MEQRNWHRQRPDRHAGQPENRLRAGEVQISQRLDEPRGHRLQTEISKSVAGPLFPSRSEDRPAATSAPWRKLGCSVGFIGKVGPDTTGDFFVQALDNLGIEPSFSRAGAFGQMRVADLRRRRRTMVTHLGAALRDSLGRRDQAVDFQRGTTATTSKVIWCRTTT